jgi:RNA polymerase sigma-70 factor (ECF subfamily)
MSGRRDTAEDLFQETWLKLARHARGLRDDSDLAAWIFTVARNEYRSHRRWALLDWSRLVVLDEDASYPSGAPDADRHTDAARGIVRLETALRALSPEHREVLLLVGVEGLEQEQAAAVVGIRYDAFRQRLARARVELERAIERDERASSNRQGQVTHGTR